jgi:Protein of unknown function (DUF3489)
MIAPLRSPRGRGSRERARLSPPDLSWTARPENGARAAAPRDGSKLALVIELLRRANGATIVDLTQATGWLPHTTRAALTGLRMP